MGALEGVPMRVWLRTGWIAAVVASAASLAPAQERADPQRPDAPPPYYDYAFGPRTTEHRTLSIDDAITAALAQASAYRQAELDERAAAEDVRQGRAALLPQLALPLAYVATTAAPRRAGVGVPSFAPANGVNEESALVTAIGVVDVAGRLHAALARSRELLVAAHAGADVARRALVLATIDAYYGLSLARQKRRLADETLALAESFSELTRELAASGQADETERLRAQVEALRRRDELEQARVGESAASDVLRSLTGIPAAVHLGVARPDSAVPPLEEFDRYTEAALGERPELRQIEGQRRAAEQDTRAAQAERRPQITYAASAGFDTVDVGDVRRYSGASASVGLTLPLFDFGASRSREEQARLRVESAGAAEAVESRALGLELYTFRASAFAARDRIRVAQARASAAEKTLNLLLARYRERKATITEIIDAQSAYSDGRAAYYQAVTDYQTSRARLAADPSRMGFRAQPLPPSDEARACRVDAAHAPRVLGLAIGMPAADAARTLGGWIPPVEDGGEAEVPAAVVSRMAPSDDPAFAIAHAFVRIRGGRLAGVRVVFPATPVWETKDAFLATAAVRFGLPGPWRAFYDWSRKTLEDPEDLRDLAAECDGFRIRLGLGFFSEGVTRVVSPHIKLDETAPAH